MKKLKNKTKRRAFKYFIELLVVFVGVTSGFLLNSWRQNATEKELEQKYLASFYNDILLDSYELDSLILISKSKNTKIVNIIKKTSAIDKPMTKKMANEIVDELLFTQWMTISNDTYDDIINSGNFNIISDYKLKEKISSYYTFLDKGVEVEQYYRDHMNTYGYPFLYKNYHLLKQEFINTNSYKSLEFTNMHLAITALNQQNIKVYQQALQKNKELQKALLYKKKFIRINLFK